MNIVDSITGIRDVLNESILVLIVDVMNNTFVRSVEIVELSVPPPTSIKLVLNVSILELIVDVINRIFVYRVEIVETSLPNSAIGFVMIVDIIVERPTLIVELILLR